MVTYGLALLVLKLSLKYKLYPQVRQRDVHTTPTPRLGGVAMFIGIVVAFAVASSLGNFSLIFNEPGKVFGLLGAALIIVVIGVADDVWDLDWLTKLAGQIIAAGVLAWQGVQLSTLPIGGQTIVSPYVSLILTIFAVVLVMNAVNFIDGLDGLVAGVAVIANSVFFIYAYLLQGQAQTEYFNLASLTTAILIGACVGFLPINFHPAKMFMGDAGALLVGLLMAASAISVTGQVDAGYLAQPDKFTLDFLPAFIPILLPIAVLIIPLLDFGMAVTRRLRAGKSPFTADRKHLHHRLLDMGHSHLHAVLILYSWTFVASVGVLAFTFVPWRWAALMFVVGLAGCAALTLAPLSRRKSREAAAQRLAAEQESLDDARYDGLDAASNDSSTQHKTKEPTE
ncbi:undecaprenyl/decaprenyl-phosphate alpha-N-acetylglucosaminyl 1-phosphate transferase [Salinibacterium sp. NSLL150]|nr:undecaprenyl/decaprenyl-phosphate alpha-N-acetylglucosaminyl 1-phosphate transferase [Salinibacterium sp. NSLL35]MBH0102949.1 undecaprenyl/decaprenyl-phosphate alpha-N-acetylglucosaminyl 1-phosphate transferase [Salinibacterium sp. NSLL150]MBH0105709.1 undecaprenyl/decaprenyl-phosphate alpha-N-acetylglucosaminyl 1-phosphate transferase [Salinibacterium sp. NSLL16]MBH0108469.1 undecaprenyl/decaprenyl-phosphate alpha-N-acetylglucosaminyl 1-phosphate transferase [Salinibacterium sp. NSLL17]MBH0